MMNIITRGYGNSQNIITQGYAGYVVIPGFLRRRKQVRVPFYIEYLFDVYAQIRKEFYEELDLISYPTLSFEYNRRFVIPINKEIEKQILINYPIKREIYQEINGKMFIISIYDRRVDSWNNIFKLLNKL